MANELKTRIVLEGEAAYTRAMSQAASEIRTLNAEQRLAEAQFKATGDAQAHAATQARILKDQIAAQQRAVDAAEKAIADLTAQGVEPNAAAMLKWRTKLANARSMLTTLQTKLNGVESDLKEDTTEFGKAGTAAEDYQESLSKIGGTINTQAAIESINKITGAIENTVRMAARATKAVIGMASDAGKWADEVKTTSEQMGVDPETLQSWQYASMFIDTEVTDIAKSWQDITKRFGDGNNDFGVGLAKMGIRIQDTSGKFLSADKVFWNIIDHLHGMTDENKRAAKATEIFGNDWQKLMPLINAGSQAYMALAEEGREVAVVSNDNVDALGEMDDSFNGLQARFMKLKLDTLAKMAPTFENVANALSKAVTALDEFIQSEEGQQALENLGSALEEIINQFIGVDENGENGFEKLVENAKGVVEGLNGALIWLKDNAGSIKTALTVIGAGYAGLYVADGVLTFMQLLKTTPLNKISAMFGGGSTTPTTPGTGGSVGPMPAPGSGTGTVMNPNGVAGFFSNLTLMKVASDLWQQGAEGQFAAQVHADPKGTLSGKNAAAELQAMMDGTAQPAGEDGEKTGKAFDAGFERGIVSSMPRVEAAALSVAGKAVNIITSVLEIHSPSKVMERLGAFTAEGFAQGIAGSAGSVMRAVDGMAGIARRAPMAAAGGAYGSAAAGGGSSYSSSFYIDKYIQNTGEDARALAQRVQDVNGWTRSGFGHRT